MKTLLYREQMVFFFKKNAKFSSFELSTALYKSLKKDLKHSEPVVLPIPDDAPEDMPRVIWNDETIKLSFSRQTLTISVDIPTACSWDKRAKDISAKVSEAFNDTGMLIDRIGIVVEANTEEDLHDKLIQLISIPDYESSKESNVSWLTTERNFNIWTYLIFDVARDVNRITIDVNSQEDYVLSERGMTVMEAVNSIVSILKERIESDVWE